MHTILFADDCPDVRTLFSRVLSEAGYLVLEAEDGVQALALAAGHAGPIDLLITDIMMPRMGGLELRRAFADRHPETAVLFISSLSARAMDLDEPFQSKPFTPAQLLSRVKALLAGRHVPPDGRPGRPFVQGRA